MPSETVYFKDEQYAFLEGMVDESGGIKNMSQSVQYCIRQQMEREKVEE